MMVLGGYHTGRSESVIGHNIIRIGGGNEFGFVI
jgi:hypothetical protein